MLYVPPLHHNRTYDEYPEEYKKFMEIYETYDESQEVNISADNIKEFEKIVKMAYNTKPS